MTLQEAPNNRLLKIIEFKGGTEFIKKLSILDFHFEDLIIKISSARLGPTIVQKKSDNSKIAIGKGFTGKIIIELIDENS